MRRPLIAANWKMHLGRVDEALALVRQLRPSLTAVSSVDVAICPPFTVIPALAEVLGNSSIGLGAQTMHWEESGAHTGEILRLLEGGPVGAFDFVGEHGRRCADQRFPLEATLHAYRCCHKVFARRVRDATVAAMVESDGLQKLVAAAA